MSKLKKKKKDWTNLSLWLLEEGREEGSEQLQSSSFALQADCDSIILLALLLLCTFPHLPGARFRFLSDKMAIRPDEI